MLAEYRTEPASALSTESESESVRKHTVLILEQTADFSDIYQIEMAANLAQFDAAAGSQPSPNLLDKAKLVLTTATHQAMLRVSIVYAYKGESHARRRH